MLSENQIQMNRDTAAANVRAALGLSLPASSWTYEQRVAYNKALAAEVLKYPTSFTPQDMNTAARVSATSYGALEDDSFQWGEFASETASNAVPVLGDFTNKLLGILALAAVAYFAVLAFRSNPHRQ